MTGDAPRFAREPVEVRRRALIDAALASLAERGLGAVSVRDVARRAGVSPGLVGHHFASFAELLATAYAEVTARVDAHLDAAVAQAGEGAEARWRAFLEASFAPEIVDRDLLSAWLGFWGLVRTDPACAAVHARTYAAYRARLEWLLAGLAAARGREINAAAAALGLSALLDGLWLELCLDPAVVTREAAMATAADWVEALAGRSPP